MQNLYICVNGEVTVPLKAQRNSVGVSCFAQGYLSSTQELNQSTLRTIVVQVAVEPATLQFPNKVRRTEPLPPCIEVAV